ncbi:MAG: insulinase family protein [Candidatus Zambryskibacteria bacterium]|nr:insulinase family protein [Candidatus Zambryskibacteria bacterium]
MKFKKTTLPNGLRVITVPTKGNPSVTTMVMVETGSNYETKEQGGLSHFLEHMCFKGTINRPTALDVARELDSMGAYNNAFTGNEYTGYYAKAEKKHFKKVLEILSDMYLNPVFPQDDLEKERGVILQEISMYDDLPQDNVYNVFTKLMYGDTPAGRPIIGPKENIKRFSRQDFVDYRRRHYVANKTIVVVAGDISEKAILKEVKKNFQNIPGGKKITKLPVKESQKVPGLSVRKQKTNQAHLIFGFRGYDAEDKKIPIITVLSSVLGGGMSGRLWQKVRHEMGACYYIDAGHHDNTDHGVLTISTGINVFRTEEVVKAVLYECKKLAEVPISDEELAKAKEHYLGHLFMHLETTHALAQFYGIEEVITGKLKSPFDIEKAVRQVTAKEVVEAAQDIFKDEKLNLAMIGNVTNQKAVKKVLTFK